MRSPPRRNPRPLRSLETLEPALLGRDVRATPGPMVSARQLRKALGTVANVLVLAVIDVCAVAIALYLGLVTKDLLDGGPVLWGFLWNAEAAWLPFISLVVFLVFAKNGLYREREVRPSGGATIASLALATVIVLVFAVGTGHEFRTFSIFLFTFTVSAVLVPLLRNSYDLGVWSVLRAFGSPRRMLICGSEQDARVVEAALKASPTRGPVETVGRIEDIEGVVRAIHLVQPDDVVLAHPPESADLLDTLEACRQHGARLRIVPTAAGLLARHAVYVPGQAVPLFEIDPPTIQGVDWVVKRTFDVVVSLVLLVLLAPLLAVAALAVRLTSPGPVIFRDRRVGIGERPFDMLKLRSMRHGASGEQAALEAHNEAGGALFKMRRDPRITPVGRVLRRFSIDELPQLLNVLRGEMTLVGPRPLPMRDYRLLERWHRKRYLVLPGVTGLWQTSGRSNLTFDDLVRLDFYYLENWSIWLDIAILARTPGAVILGRGAF